MIQEYYLPGFKLRLQEIIAFIEAHQTPGLLKIKATNWQLTIENCKLPTFHYSAAFERDWEFLQAFNPRCKVPWFFLFQDKSANYKVLPSKFGLTAKECFYLFDSLGVITLCREPLRLARAYEAKFNLGVSLEVWSESCHDGTGSPREIRQHLAHYPRWVTKEFNNRHLAQY